MLLSAATLSIINLCDGNSIGAAAVSVDTLRYVVKVLLHSTIVPNKSSLLLIPSSERVVSSGSRVLDKTGINLELELQIIGEKL